MCRNQYKKSQKLSRMYKMAENCHPEFFFFLFSFVVFFHDQLSPVLLFVAVIITVLLFCYWANTLNLNRKSHLKLLGDVKAYDIILKFRLSQTVSTISCDSFVLHSHFEFYFYPFSVYLQAKHDSFCAKEMKHIHLFPGLNW